MQNKQRCKFKAKPALDSGTVGQAATFTDCLACVFSHGYTRMLTDAYSIKSYNRLERSVSFHIKASNEMLSPTSHFTVHLYQ